MGMRVDRMSSPADGVPVPTPDPRHLADVEALEATLLAVLEGREPDDGARTDAAARSERLAGVLAAGGHPATGERARAVGLALRDGRALADRLAPLADGVAEMRRALDVLRPAGSGDGDTHPASPGEDRRRPSASLLVVTDTPHEASELADAAAVRGARCDLADRSEAPGLLASRRPDVVVLLGSAAVGAEAEALVTSAVEAGCGVLAVVAPGAGAAPAGAALVPAGLGGEELVATALAFRDEDPGRGARVLVVSDDEAVAAAVTAAVAHGGGTAEVRGHDGDPSELRVAPPDLLVVDAGVAPDSALAWCRGLRLTQSTAALPVVLLVPAGMALETALRSGPDDVLHHPVEPGLLQACLRNRLSRARAVRRLGDADLLTGLPRQRVGQRRLGRLVESVAQAGGPLSIALVGIDGLEQVNASSGRAAGNAVVVAAARLLRSVVRDDDLVARWSGGEFLVAGRELAVPTTVERMEQALAQARALTPAGAPAGTRLRLSAGIAGYPEAGTTGTGLAEQAADALVQARRAGGDRVVVAAGAEAEAGCDVLLVEDSTVSAALVQHALGGLGLRVETIADGADAARRLTDTTIPMPRVVLLDWELPGTNGLGVLRRMAEAGTLSRTRVVMLTSRSGGAVRSSGRESRK
jgi:diguanylate cyclase (GGDEF)-like protein